MSDPDSAGGRFSRPRYSMKRDIFRLAGGEFRVYDTDTGEAVLYFRQKAFRLREDIRLYTDDSMSEELASITTEEILDFGATYAVTDSRTDEHVGSLRKEGVKSLARDEWAILSPSGANIGSIIEDSLTLALLRRAIGLLELVPFVGVLAAAGYLLPQRFNVNVGDVTACNFKQNMNPFALRIHGDFSEDVGGSLDRRLGLATMVLLCAIEDR